MKTLLATRRPPRSAQRGAAAVELALIAIPFFLLLFGAIEFARLLYLWNTVQEVTRNAARQAVVTDFSNAAAVAAIRRSAVFRLTDGSLPGAPELTNAHVNIRYLNAAGTEATPLPADPGENIAACLDMATAASCIRFVEVCVSTGTTCDGSQLLSFAPFVGFFTGSGPNRADLTGVTIPMSTVRMPAESLGFQPN
jgi:Flp pilus assembly protein TadG